MIIRSTTNEKITVSKIAALAGVSPATVSRAINQQNLVKEDTYIKIVNAIRELGGDIVEEPTISSAAVPQNSGLVVINLPSLNNPFYGPIIHGLRQSVERHGYSLLINEGHINTNTIDSLVNMICQNHVIGLITTNHIEPQIYKRLTAVTCVVQCCEFNEEVDLPYISIDDSSAAKNAVEHLLSRGRRRIALLNGPLQYKYARYRREGYMKALEGAGIPIRPEYIVHLPHIDSDIAVSACMQLLSLREAPDAFFAISDVYGYAALRACYLSGKTVPGDVSVVGFDDLDNSKYTIPSLSSVNQPKTQMGFMAGETLFEKLSNPACPNKKILLETELIVRESSL